MPAGQLPQRLQIDCRRTRIEDLPGANGQAVVYNFEAQGGTALRRVGINVKTDLKPGQTYTYTFSPARNGSPSGFLSAIVIGGKRFQITML